MDNKKLRIGILGIGAVGGYFGGLLAEKYHGSDEAEVIFIARPDSVKAINERGLKLIMPSDEKTIWPDRAVSDAATLPPLDLLICAVKSYDLEESMATFGDCITQNTIILPLLNGIDAKDRIKKMYPRAQVIDGCVYLVSRRVEPGVIRELGNIHKMYFGADDVERSRLLRMEELFANAGIDCELSADIRQTIWQKYIFTAAMASLTSYLDMTTGSILANPEHRQLMVGLLAELKQIADREQVFFPGDIIADTIKKMESLPFESTTSMHSDFQKGGRTEYLSITGHAVKLGDDLGIDTPLFDRILLDFEKRQK